MLETILIAPDKFKGSLSAVEVALAIQAGILRYNPNIITLINPLADGGEGSLEVIANFNDFQKIEVETYDPLLRPISSFYYINKDHAYIELSSASGLSLLESNERNPMQTNTFGTGCIIRHAMKYGSKHIHLFIGGSATNDMGLGIAEALGYGFYDITGNSVSPIGTNLILIDRIKSPPDHLIENIEITVHCDVDNLLYGPDGASHTYANQKGANPDEIKLLESGVKHVAELIKKQFGVDLQNLVGGGAAGGTAAGLSALVNAKVSSGINELIKLTETESKVKQSNVIISGEGKVDQQTLHGKVVHGLSILSNKHNKPYIILSGANTLTATESKTLYHTSMYNLTDFKQKETDDVIENASKYLEEMAFAWAKEYYS